MAFATRFVRLNLTLDPFHAPKTTADLSIVCIGNAIICPKIVSRTILSVAIQHADYLVCHAGLLFLDAVLSRLLAVDCQDADALTKIRREIFPELPILISLHQRSVKDANCPVALYALMSSVLRGYLLVYPAMFKDAGVDVSRLVPVDLASRGAIVQEAVLRLLATDIARNSCCQSFGSLCRRYFEITC